MVPEWSFLTNHALAVSFIANNPDVRLRELANGLEVTERTAFALVADLVDAGYVVKEKAGRRNRYHVQAQRPLSAAVSAECTIGDLIGLLAEEETDSGRDTAGDRRHRTRRKDDVSTPPASAWVGPRPTPITAPPPLPTKRINEASLLRLPQAT